MRFAICKLVYPVFIFGIVGSVVPLSGYSNDFSQPVELGKCISSVSDSNQSPTQFKVKSQAKSKIKSEEEFAEEEAEKAHLTNHEILARLIFSEALSTGYWNNRCESPTSKILMESIGWGILNRVKNNKNGRNPYFGVIFQKNQFRTSFSMKKDNPFAVSFLCPLKAQKYLDHAIQKTAAAELYRQAGEVSSELISRFEKTGIPSQYDGITNFFYPKSEFFGEKRPSWAQSSVPNQNKGYRNILGSKNPCVEFYLRAVFKAPTK